MTKKNNQRTEEESDANVSLEAISETLNGIKYKIGAEEASKIEREITGYILGLGRKYGGIRLGRQHRGGLLRELRSAISTLGYDRVFNQLDLSAMILGEEEKDKSVRTLLNRLWANERRTYGLARLEIRTGGILETHYIKPAIDDKDLEPEPDQIIDALPKTYLEQTGEELVERFAKQVLRDMKEEGYVSYSVRPPQSMEVSPVLESFIKNGFNLGTFLRTGQQAVIYHSRRLREKQELD